MKHRPLLRVLSLLLTCALLLAPVGAVAAGPSQFTSYIAGFVFLDLDGNGARGADEPGIEGVEVRLTDPSEATQVTHTNESGLFLFTAGTMGWYMLEEIDPKGMRARRRTSALSSSIPASPRRFFLEMWRRRSRASRC